MNVTPKEAVGAYYRYKNQLRDCDHEGHSWKECPEVRFMFNLAFMAGARYATKITGELAPYLERFTEFVIWLQEQPDPDGYQLDLPE